MHSYTLTEARNRHGEVFDQAMTEPVLLTRNARPTHVILSAKAYSKLIERLGELEDKTFGAAAEQAAASSPMVGSDDFTAVLKRLADAAS